MATNSEVAHRWAQDDKKIRLVRSGRMSAEWCSFAGGEALVLYSYNTVIGAWISAPSGQRVVLISCAGCSGSTAGHINLARYALPREACVFEVYDPLPLTEEEHRGNVEGMLGKAAELLDRASRARTRGGEFRTDAELLFERTKAYIDAFGVNVSFRSELARILLPEAIRRWREENEKRREEDKKRRVGVERAERRAERKNLARWLRGEPIELQRISDEDGPYLRRTEFGGKVYIETSFGATVPWDEAVRLFRLALHFRSKSLTFKRKGSSVYVGVYTLSSVADDGGVVIGCHRIAWTRMESFARSLGALDEQQPSDELLTQNEPVDT